MTERLTVPLCSSCPHSSGHTGCLPAALTAASACRRAATGSRSQVLWAAGQPRSGAPAAGSPSTAHSDTRSRKTMLKSLGVGNPCDSSEQRARFLLVCGTAPEFYGLRVRFLLLLSAGARAAPPGRGRAEQYQVRGLRRAHGGAGCGRRGSVEQQLPPGRAREAR